MDILIIQHNKEYNHVYKVKMYYKVRKLLKFPFLFLNNFVLPNGEKRYNFSLDKFFLTYSIKKTRIIKYDPSSVAQI